MVMSIDDRGQMFDPHPDPQKISPSSTASAASLFAFCGLVTQSFGVVP